MSYLGMFVVLESFRGKRRYIQTESGLSAAFSNLHRLQAKRHESVNRPGVCSATSLQL
jgi:hypothetical protein